VGVRNTTRRHRRRFRPISEGIGYLSSSPEGSTDFKTILDKKQAILCQVPGRCVTPVDIKAFEEGDVYIDYPFEDVKFRWVDGKVYRKFHNSPEDTEHGP
jgi:hypothetical protein